MIAPIVLSLAVMVPATYGVSDLITLRRNPPEGRRARRSLRRRAAALLTASALAATTAILHLLT